MLALAAIVAAAPAGHQHVLTAPGARAPDRVALLAGATPDLWSEAAAASEHARAALLSSKARGTIQPHPSRQPSGGIWRSLTER